jgi:hypothetical protein
MVFLGGLGVLRTWDVALAAQMLSERWWPWGLMAVGTAMATAYNIDTEERPGRRWVEAALQAAVGAAGALIVYLRFQEACGPEPACALPLGGILLAGLISGGVIGWFVPTWCREPQTMTIDYKGWTVLVTAHARPNGHIAPAIEVMRFLGRGQRLSADAQAAALPFAQEFPSAEEALAKAVAYGRQHIDADSEVTGPARAHAA